MSTAQQLLVGYGVVVLAYGFLLGVPLAAARMKAPAASRHLVNAHLSGLIQAPIHLGLAFAIGAVAFDSGFATTGAALLVAASLMETAGGTANWLTDSGDQFAERSLGFRLNALSGPLALPGAVIIALGTLANL